MKNLFKNLITVVFFLTTGIISAQETPSVFTYKHGEMKVTLLSEAQQAAKVSILIDATEEMLKEYAPNGTFPNAMNAFLVQTNGKNILFDTGMGRKLFENLESLGVTAEQIDIICITHMHGDHIGGMLREGKAAFAKAEVYLPKPEYDYWMSIEAKQPQQVIEVYKEKLHLFVPGQLGKSENDILPGIQGIAAYGHTPGHVGFMLTSQGKKILIWGDLTHAMAIQMPYPQIAVTYDVNPKDAISARKEILEYVALNKIPIAGMHISYPGMGGIQQENKGGYRFIPFE